MTYSPLELVRMYYVPIMSPLTVDVQVVKEWKETLSAPRASISALFENISPSSTPVIVALSMRQAPLTVRTRLSASIVNYISNFKLLS